MTTPEAPTPPCIPVRTVTAEGKTVLPTPVGVSCKHRAKCDPSQVWRDWKSDVTKPERDWRTEVLELLLTVVAKTGPVIQKVTCLVDTGARTPITFRTGLFADRKLITAKYPVRFTQADGTPMTGGRRGLFLSLQLPVCNGADQYQFVRTMPLFAYEADLHGTDVLIGYSFMKAFNLAVDCGADRLCWARQLPAATKRSPAVVRTPEKHWAEAAADTTRNARMCRWVSQGVGGSQGRRSASHPARAAIRCDCPAQGT